jgi:hypothetical protein
MDGNPNGIEREPTAQTQVPIFSSREDSRNMPERFQKIKINVIWREAFVVSPPDALPD